MLITRKLSIVVIIVDLLLLLLLLLPECMCRSFSVLVE